MLLKYGNKLRDFISLGTGLLLVLINSLACINETNLKRVCPKTCYAIPGITDFPDWLDETREGTLHLLQLISKDGECRRGTPICDEEDNNKIIDCIGEVLPTFEICDGKDNNCNRVTDENLIDLPNAIFYNLNPGFDNPCTSALGECLYATVRCGGEDGWWCDYSTAPHVALENGTLADREFPPCDLRDNDCDGQIDEDVYRGDFCFDVPEEDWWKATNPPCRPGTEMCQNGERTCVGQVLPQVEECNFEDSDCNSIVDDVFDQDKYNVVIGLENSGSITSYVPAIRLFFSMLFDLPSTKFSFGVIDFSSYSSDVNVVFDIGSDPITMESWINTSAAGWGSGCEFSLTSMDMVLDSSNPLQLSWTPGAKRIYISISDEGPQVENTDINYNWCVMAVPDITVYTSVWSIRPSVTPYHYGRSSVSSWTQLVQSAGGEFFDLVANPDMMFDNMVGDGRPITLVCPLEP